MASWYRPLRVYCSSDTAKGDDRCLKNAAIPLTSVSCSSGNICTCAYYATSPAVGARTSSFRFQPSARADAQTGDAQAGAPWKAEAHETRTCSRSRCHAGRYAPALMREALSWCPIWCPRRLICVCFQIHKTPAAAQRSSTPVRHGLLLTSDSQRELGEHSQTSVAPARVATNAMNGRGLGEAEVGEAQESSSSSTPSSSGGMRLVVHTRSLAWQHMHAHTRTETPAHAHAHTRTHASTSTERKGERERKHTLTHIRLHSCTIAISLLRTQNLKQKNTHDSHTHSSTLTTTHTQYRHTLSHIYAHTHTRLSGWTTRRKHVQLITTF